MNFINIILFGENNQVESCPFNIPSKYELDVVNTNETYLLGGRGYPNYFLVNEVIGAKLFVTTMSEDDKGNEAIAQFSEELIPFVLFENKIKELKFENYRIPYPCGNFETRRELVESEIMSRYGEVSQALKIFTYEADGETLHVQVLTNNTKYDRDLMMRLLQIEYEIEKKHKDIFFYFDYLPKIYETEKEVVIKGARLIYAKRIVPKKIYEYRHYSLTTSAAQQGTGLLPVGVSV